MFQPYQDVFLWALVISFVLQASYRFLGDQKAIRQLKEDMKFYKDKAKEAQKAGDVKKSQEYLNEMMKLSQKQFSLNMKPMMISLVLVMIILGFVSQTYAETVVRLPFNLPLLGSELNWFWWYFFSTIPAVWFFRKMLGVQ
ncbi:MAG: DUF106 domain-containing protein [Candidatus Aenigmarchaeota archaeon]|nr:DUF106 domain-containing protein [Candidatus Aenigmarchaeota archaeon]